MSEYGYTTTHKPTPLLSYNHVQARKAARKKLLETIEQRRKQNYLRWYKKMQLKAQTELDTIA